MDRRSYFEAQARDCRRSAADIRNPAARQGLLKLADRYEREAWHVVVARAQALG